MMRNLNDLPGMSDTFGGGQQNAAGTADNYEISLSTLYRYKKKQNDWVTEQVILLFAV